MAGQLGGSLANNDSKIQITGKENESRIGKRFNSFEALPTKQPKLEALPMKQPKLLPNPLLRQVRRRPAQLNLSKSIPVTSAGPVSTATATKPPKVVSVRDKLLQGISMDLGHLQQNPAAFDRVFPPQQAAAAAKGKSKRARQSTEILLDKFHTGEAAELDEEEEEARRFEKKMRSV